MTRIPHNKLPRPALRWRATVALGLAGVIGLLSVPSGADAARTTTSDAIADEAERAVDALERWRDGQNPVDYVRFVRGRDAAATMTATELEIDARTLASAWADAPATKQHAVLAAMSQLGVPYRSLKSDPDVGFDCSGLTTWAFAEAGVELPRVSRDQIRSADDVERGGAAPGDLVYYPGHIGIYLGAETYVHSPNSGNHVEARHLPGKSLRFGDPVAGLEVDFGELLVDRSLTVAQ